jgi:hypothetical protein
MDKKEGGRFNRLVLWHPFRRLLRATWRISGAGAATDYL